jgi:uncharacterized protein DUF5335
MRTVEIPREAWVQQLNEFTAIHEGWLVSLDVLDPELGAQPEIVNLPLVGVSADRIDQDGAIALSVMVAATGHFTHVIQGVTRIYVERADDGADAALEIESGDGTRTILRFHVAALPETVDGIVRQSVIPSRQSAPSSQAHGGREATR